MDPVTATVATAALVGGGLQAQATRQHGIVQDEVAKHNSQVAALEGRAMQQRRLEEARLLRIRNKKVAARARAERSPLFVLEENAAIASLEEAEILQAGVIEAESAAREAQITRRIGRVQKRASRILAATSLLGTATRVTGSLLNR